VVADTALKSVVLSAVCQAYDMHLTVLLARVAISQLTVNGTVTSVLVTSVACHGDWS